MKTSISHFHLFSGMGGAAYAGKHLNVSTQSLVAGSLSGSFRCLGGVDVDRGAIDAFTRFTGVRGTHMDLFSLEQYCAFHGKEPSPGWREASLDDLRGAAQGVSPDILVTSPPCKGFSGLVSESRAASGKYTALNALTIRGIDLAIRAWEDDPPSFWLLENVPRLVNRGSHLLAQMVQMLDAAGYAVNYTIPDLGAKGGLGQSRKRLHLVARHREKVPVTVFDPPDRPLLSVGEVLGAFPRPGDPAAGILHRLPELEWRTWVRLALIRAGGDWRDLQELAVENGVLRDYALVQDTWWHPGVLGVTSWDSHSGTITGRGGATNGNHAVADPRVTGPWHNGSLGVGPWDHPGATITAADQPTGGVRSLADPRVSGEGWGSYGQYGILPWREPAPTVTANAHPGGGRAAVADPRFPWAAEKVAGTTYRTAGHYGVIGWGETAGAITASGQHDNGRGNIADPRGPEPLPEGVRLELGEDTRSNVYAVTPWDAPGRVVTGSCRPASCAGVIADPRMDGVRHNNVYRVVRWDEPSVAVTAGQGPSSGGVAIADPHYPWRLDASGSGAPSVADPRDPNPVALPTLSARGVWVIQALDGTWHRPMSVLERAALQGLVDPESIEHFSAAVKGASVARVSEWVGNAIPPPAMAETLRAAGVAILLSRAGETFVLSNLPVWVKPLARSILLGGLHPEVAR